MVSYPLQLLPNHLWTKLTPDALHPSTNTSRRLEPHEATDGSPSIQPPRLSQLLQFVPSQYLCMRSLAVPRANISMRFGPQLTVTGLAPVAIADEFPASVGA